MTTDGGRPQEGAARRTPKRRRVGGRAALEAATRALCRLWPGLAPRIGFFPDVLPHDALGPPAHVDRVAPPNPLTAEDRRFVAEIAGAFEAWSVPDPAAGDPLVFRREARVVEGLYLGRAGAVATETPRALVTPFGAGPGGRRNRPHRVRARVRVEGLALPVLAHNNIWHLYDDVLIPLIALCEGAGGDTGGPRPAAVLLPAQAAGFTRGLTTALARRYGLRVETAAADAHLAARLLLWRQTRPNTEWLALTPERAALVRRAIAGALEVPPPGPPQGLHLDRGAGPRRFADQAGLDRLLARRGLVRFVAHAGDLAGQVAAFAAAPVVLAAHGAGLVNLIHCPPGARVVEVLPTDYRKSTYRMLARQLGHDYAAVNAARGGRRDALEVDLHTLDALLA
jgi:hypothetical protein